MTPSRSRWKSQKIGDEQDSLRGLPSLNSAEDDHDAVQRVDRSAGSLP